MTSAQSEKIRILLVDDEIGVLRAFELMLEAFGFEVHSFSDPEEALQAIRQVSPDWIVSDLRMPKIDGFQLLEQRNASFPDIPFILISGHAKEQEIEKARALGAQAVLQKPFDPAQLTAIIESSMRQPAAIG